MRPETDGALDFVQATFALRERDLGGEVDVRSDDELGWLAAAFSVRDTGAGIREEVLPHIFERFNRADKSRSRETAANSL